MISSWEVKSELYSSGPALADLICGWDWGLDLDGPGERSVEGVGVGHVLVDARNEAVVVSPSVVPPGDLVIDEVVVGQRKLSSEIDWKVPGWLSSSNTPELFWRDLLLSAWVSFTGSLYGKPEPPVSPTEYLYGGFWVRPDRKRLDCSSLEISFSGISQHWGRSVTGSWYCNWSRHQAPDQGGNSNLQNLKTSFFWPGQDCQRLQLFCVHKKGPVDILDIKHTMTVCWFQFFSNFPVQFLQRGKL